MKITLEALAEELSAAYNGEYVFDIEDIDVGGTATKSIVVKELGPDKKMGMALTTIGDMMENFDGSMYEAVTFTMELLEKQFKTLNILTPETLKNKDFLKKNISIELVNENYLLPSGCTKKDCEHFPGLKMCMVIETDTTVSFLQKDMINQVFGSEEEAMAAARKNVFLKTGILSPKDAFKTNRKPPIDFYVVAAKTDKSYCGSAGILNEDLLQSFAMKHGWTEINVYPVSKCYAYITDRLSLEDRFCMGMLLRLEEANNGNFLTKEVYHFPVKKCENTTDELITSLFEEKGEKTA